MQYLYFRIMEISSASLYDQVFLSANIRALYRPKYQCDKQLRELRLRNPKADDKYINNVKKARGCGSTVNYLVERIGNIEFNTCLCNFKHPLTNTLLTMSRHYENGVMPFSGSYMEQPARVLELLELVYSAKTEEEIEMQKQIKAKGKKHGR